MRTLRLLLAVLVLSPSAAPAQTARPAPPPAAEAEKPKPSCPCDRYNFKPLSKKAEAAVTYWTARRRAKSTVTVAGVFVLFAYMTQSGGAVNQAQDSYSDAMRDLSSARETAEAAGAVKVVGEDLKEDSIEFLLKEGVDFVLKT